jgi:hypothetical protein
VLGTCVCHDALLELRDVGALGEVDRLQYANNSVDIGLGET